MGTMKPISAYLTAFLRLTPGLILSLFLVSCSGGQTPVQTGTPVVPTSSAERTPLVTATRTPLAPTATPTSTATPVSTLDVQAEDLNGLIISFWHPWSGAQGDVVQNLITEFNRSNEWGITVQATAYNGVSWLEEEVEAALSSGTLPDALVGYNFQVLHWDAYGGLLADLNKYANDPIWGLSEAEQADFYPVFWNQDIARSTNGQPRRAGVPLQRSGLVLYYNQSYAYTLGFARLPETTFDLRMQACSAAEANARDGQTSNDGTGGWLITSQPSLLVSWIYAFGGEITRPDGRGYQFNTPEVGQAFDYLKGLQDSGCAYQAIGADPASELAARRALFFAGSLSELPAVEAAFTQAGNRDSWTILPFPGADTSPVLVTYGLDLMIIRSETARELAAWLFTEWLVAPENQAWWATANRTLPVRQSALELLSEPMEESPHWAAALELLPLARSEPAYASWSVMRWALTDAMAALLDPAFTSGQIPDLQEALEQTALDIYTQVR